MPPPRRRKMQLEAARLVVPDNVAVDGIEIVQVVQDLDHSVALIAGKQTVVRVYLSRPSGSAITVRGEISVRRTANGPAQKVPSLDTVSVTSQQNGRLRRKREDIRLSLNFLLPASLTTAGRIYVSLASLTNVRTGAEVTCTNCGDNVVRVRFIESPPLIIRLIKFRYTTDDPPLAHQPSARDIALIKSWLGRAYPVSVVQASERTVEANFSPPFDPDDSTSTCDEANAQLTALRTLDINAGRDQRTRYYGLVADSGDFMRGGASDIPVTPDPSAVASGPTGPQGYSWDTDGSYGDWYGAHELAHTFGRLHPGFCNGNSGDDAEYPFKRGRLSNSDGTFVGFDIGDQALGLPMKALKGESWHDVMTYCSHQWMSSYTYEGIRVRLVAEHALGAESSPEGLSLEADVEARAAANSLEVNMASGDFINIVGTINLTKKTGKILYVNPVSNVMLQAAGQDHSVQVRVKSADDQVLQQQPAIVKLNPCSDSKKDQTGIIEAVVSWHPEAKVVELLIDGNVVDTYRASGAAERSLTNLRASDASEEAVSLPMDAAESEAGNLSYNVQVSIDNGQTWETVAVGRSSPDVTIDRNQFEPGTNVTVRVIATDGFNSHIVTGETFSVDEPEE